MLDLRNIFLRKGEIELTKEQVAELLKVSPEAFEEFEKAYQLNNTASDNFMDFSVQRQKNEVSHFTDMSKALDEVVDRIVNELLAQTMVIKLKEGKLKKFLCISDKDIPYVTLEELEQFPLDVRPQLTSRYIKKDLERDSYLAVLYNYKKYLEETNEKKKRVFYGMFRQGLDTLDLDFVLYEMLGMNQNSMENWLPALQLGVEKQDFFRIPDTTLIRVPLSLLQLSRLDYKSLNPTTLKIVDRFCIKAFELDETKEYFVKTGVFSSKFFFRNAYVHGVEEVRELGEYLLLIQNQSCMMCSSLTQPHFYGVNTTNTWVAREYIKDKENNPCIYNGMPLHTEYRVFVDFDTKEILGINPYWDPEVMKQRFGHEKDSNTPNNIHDYVIYQMHEDTLMGRYFENKDLVLKHVESMLPNIPLNGQWSMDIMQNGEDFYVIDMADAKNSALNSCVKKGRIKDNSENWLPILRK